MSCLVTNNLSTPTLLLPPLALAGRFFEAHLVTSAYRIIATDFLPEDRENAARAVGLTDQCSTTLGSIVSTVLVARYASC